LITCANLGEILLPTGLDSLSFLIPAYIEMLSSQEKAGIKSYACIFDQVPKQWRKDGVHSTHSMELCYVFGDWDNSTDAWAGLKNNLCFVKSKYDDPGLTEIDRNIAEEMMRRWVQFAKTGDPNIDDSIKWPNYESSSDQYLYISDPIEL
jgi:carboxylesterase type B